MSIEPLNEINDIVSVADRIVRRSRRSWASPSAIRWPPSPISPSLTGFASVATRDTSRREVPLRASRETISCAGMQRMIRSFVMRAKGQSSSSQGESRPASRGKTSPG